MTNLMTYEDFHDIYNRYYSALCVFADSYIDDKVLAADITQDVFFKLWDRRSEFTDLLNIKAYLYTAVHNRALNELNHRETVRSHFDKLNIFTVDYTFHKKIPTKVMIGLAAKKPATNSTALIIMYSAIRFFDNGFLCGVYL